MTSNSRPSAILPLMLSMAGQASHDYFRIRPVETPLHKLNFKWRNQRQIRKNRRRAAAAGKRHAFA